MTPPHKQAEAPTEDLMLAHRIIRGLAGMAMRSFFTEVKVIGEDNVPRTGPIIVAATHHNMMLDPVTLSSAFPHARILNYWSKASLFKNPIVRKILLSSGNIPVDRKSKDRQTLFKGTFEALAKGSAVALFPEGTSYTEPRIMQVKDGAAWTALEFLRWVQNNPDKAPAEEVRVVPAAIVYTNKSKYRSSAILEFGPPISMDEYRKQFFSEEEGESRLAAKRLTNAIQTQLTATTINSPDWDTLYTARMARDILWTKHNSLALEDFVPVSQTLVDVFATPGLAPNMPTVRRALLEYYSLLQSTHLTDSVLSALPLPRTLDPRVPTPLPSRLYTLAILLRDSVSSLARLPFFLFPLIVHSPVYVMGRLGASLAENEEESIGQNKVVFGLLSLMLIYPAAFFFLWALFWYTRTAAVLVAATLYLFASYHNRMIDANYESAKRLIATWRVLIGIWAPKRWEFSVNALSPYTQPILPKESPFVDKSKRQQQPQSGDESSTETPPAPVTLPHLSDLNLLPGTAEPPVQLSKRNRPPSRRIMRHVLRARVEAVKALAAFFNQLEASGSSNVVKSSPHLGREFGLSEDERKPTEVIAFLRARGARIPSMAQPSMEGEWAAMSSDTES